MIVGVVMLVLCFVVLSPSSPYWWGGLAQPAVVIPAKAGTARTACAPYLIIAR